MRDSTEETSCLQTENHEAILKCPGKVEHSNGSHCSFFPCKSEQDQLKRNGNR